MILILLTASLLITELYTIYIRKKYGIQKSISASARLIMDKQGRSPLFFLFIALLALPLTYVANNPVATLAGSFLMLIGLYTGFNPNFWDKEVQQFVHTASVFIAIALFEVGLILINPYTAFSLIPVVVLVIVNLKKDNYIWRCEKIVIYQIYIVLLILNL
jgi:hypothetical protein